MWPLPAAHLGASLWLPLLALTGLSSTLTSCSNPMRWLWQGNHYCGSSACRRACSRCLLVLEVVQALCRCVHALLNVDPTVFNLRLRHCEPANSAALRQHALPSTPSPSCPPMCSPPVHLPQVAARLAAPRVQAGYGAGPQAHFGCVMVPVAQVSTDGPSHLQPTGYHAVVCPPATSLAVPSRGAGRTSNPNHMALQTGASQWHCVPCACRRACSLHQGCPLVLEVLAVLQA